MAHRRILFLAARLFFGGFILLTSLYCLLAYIPFTYHWFIQNPLVFWFPIFVKFHTYFYITAVIAVSTTLSRHLDDPRTRRVALAFIGFNVLVCVLFIVDPFLTHLPNDFRSFIWSLLALFPLSWISLLDLSSSSPENRATDSESFSPTPALFAAFFVTGLYSTIAGVKAGVQFGRADISAITWSLLSHLVIFLAVFLALEATFRIVRRFTPAHARSIALSVVGFAFTAVLLRKLVLATLGLNNWLADLYSIAFALVLIAFFRGLRAREANLYTAPKSSPKPIAALWLAALIFIAAATPTLIDTMDWNFLLQKLSAVIVWTGVIALSYKLLPARRSEIPVSILLLIAAITFAGYKAPALLHQSSASALDRYAGYDVSFKVARDILAPVVDDDSYKPFYAFLQQNTGLPESAKVTPIDIKLVEDLQPTTAEKPNIFIFVIDSLRQDYVSPYNNAVTFTPAIESFAHESVVFEKAFSRYGGTVLSEPAIWTGSMQLHKQYIQPFFPLNSLQHLLDTDGYQSFITIDPVVEIMLRKNASITELDKNPSYWTDYDFCQTLKELETKLDGPRDPKKPIFVYSQPQNLHTVTLFRLGNKRPPAKDYPGFHALHASELERMDKSFGEFIQHLKSRGLYGNSIIVLTSDHGDSLGEFGRWGHGSTMFPEVVRIPLIVHLPSNMKDKFYVNPQQLAFSMDITPSLYYLLGHRPLRNDEVLGRPLFTDSKSEHDQYLRDSYLLVSSYGPVYSRLTRNGDSLFIVDAAAHKNYLFDLADDPLGTHNLVTSTVLSENEQFIRREVTSINRFFNFQQTQVVASTH
ncbi:MAG: hypothetical protein JWO13_2069 [Acidobacteriales bacterium]|nr:hypothetical protein [Terriglobales bacterium]